MDADPNSRSKLPSSTYLDNSTDPVISCLRDRMAQIAKLPTDHMEPVLVARFQKGQEFGNHVDFFEAGYPEDDRELSRAGQRKFTFISYLSSLTENQGGHTDFVNLNLTIAPNKNDALFFSNVDANGAPEESTLRHDLPVLTSDAEKWELVAWFRERAYH